ncbi:hypothetical protein PZ897_03230 [Hoeflea sp. YIM 152468]|uniref:hypothetical protein n=1 Tax=Hoeflea sp. YIM 152468 TaxID=3031759 RepID=UPI0023DA4552|nr:hypothetical protein [Hoeflea sp. YIM 152468]MDF1607182.1 hypothetical protein [Hoeflea sp. YIM 152468]
MATYHEFDDKAVAAAIQAASDFYAEKGMTKEGARTDLADDGHMNIAAQCISVTVDNGKICLNLPLGIGKICLPIPSIFPNGTAAEACLSICTTWHIPTGVKVTVSIAGKVIVTKSFGKC